MEKNLSVRLNLSELEQLKTFCSDHKVSKSDAIRQMIMLTKKKEGGSEKNNEARRSVWATLGEV